MLKPFLIKFRRIELIFFSFIKNLDILLEKIKNILGFLPPPPSLSRIKMLTNGSVLQWRLWCCVLRTELFSVEKNAETRRKTIWSKGLWCLYYLFVSLLFVVTGDGGHERNKRRLRAGAGNRRLSMPVCRSISELEEAVWGGGGIITSFKHESSQRHTTRPNPDLYRLRPQISVEEGGGGTGAHKSINDTTWKTINEDRIYEEMWSLQC